MLNFCCVILLYTRVVLGQTLCLGEQWCTIVDEPEVYEDRAVRESNCTSVTRTGQTTPPTVCCWDSASPHTLRWLAVYCMMIVLEARQFALRLALDVVIRTSCPILSRIRRIFQAPGCLKLDYKKCYNAWRSQSSDSKIFM